MSFADFKLTVYPDGTVALFGPDKVDGENRTSLGDGITALPGMVAAAMRAAKGDRVSMNEHLRITVERHDEEFTAVGFYSRDTGEFITTARLETFHHEAAGWADATVGLGVERVTVRRPRDYNGCPCNRCLKGWTQLECRHEDRELPGDRDLPPDPPRKFEVLRVTNVSTGATESRGTVRADDAEHARRLACERGLIRDFETFRVVEVP